MNKIIFFTILISIVALLQAQSIGDLDFAERAGGTQTEKGTSVATFEDGSSIVVGDFQDSATFGAGEANETTLTSAGLEDVFAARYNADGTLAFAVLTASGTASNGRAKVTVLTGEAFAISGNYTGTATFGIGEANETTLTSAGSEDAFVAGYNADGTLAFAVSAGGTGLDFCLGISSFADDSVVITGGFENTATFGAGDPNETALVSGGGRDIYVAKYNADGTLAFAVSASGTALDDGRNVTTFSNGSFLAVGRIGSTGVTFGVGEANETFINGGADRDAFVAKYNANGTLAFAKLVGGGDEFDEAVAVKALSDASFFVLGTFRDVAVFGVGEANETTFTSAGEEDIFLAKYSADGILQLIKQAGGTGIDRAFGLAVLSDGSAIVAGDFENTATFGPGEANETALTSAGSSDIFVAKYNTDGTLSVVERTGGTLIERGNDVDAFASGSFVITGSFSDSVVFGAGDANETTLTSAGDVDIFVAQHAAPGDISIDIPALGTLSDYGIELTFGNNQGEVQVVISWDDNDGQSLLFLERTLSNPSISTASRADQKIDVTYKNVNANDTLFLRIGHQDGVSGPVSARNITVTITKFSEAPSIITIFPNIGDPDGLTAPLQNSLFLPYLPTTFRSTYPTGTVITEELTQNDETFRWDGVDTTGNLLPFQAQIEVTK